MKRRSANRNGWNSISTTDRAHVVAADWPAAGFVDAAEGNSRRSLVSEDTPGLVLERNFGLIPGRSGLHFFKYTTPACRFPREDIAIIRHHTAIRRSANCQLGQGIATKNIAVVSVFIAADNHQHLEQQHLINPMRDLSGIAPVAYAPR